MNRNLILVALLSLVIIGCVSEEVLYRPTQSYEPGLPYNMARAKVMKLKSAHLEQYYPSGGFMRSGSITNIWVQSDNIGFKLDSGARIVIDLKSAENIDISRYSSAVFIRFGDLNIYPEDAHTLDSRKPYVDALYALKLYAISAKPHDDTVADAAFSELAKNYRRQQVKPAPPEEARKFAVQAEYAIEKKNYEYAITRYEDAIRIDPTWAQCYFNLAVVLSEVERYPDAIEAMKKYLMLEPDAPDARAAQDKIYQWDAMLSMEGDASSAPESSKHNDAPGGAEQERSTSK